MFDRDTLLLNHAYALSPTDSISFQVCKFYLTAVDSSAQHSYFLVDAANKNSKQLSFHSQPTEVYFGVDAKMSDNPDFRGALDPIHGMYWTWQSGFIHLKMEATISRQGSAKQKLEYHIGGFSDSLNTCLALPDALFGKRKQEWVISMSTFLHQLDLSKTTIMSPQPAAVTVAKHFSNCIR